MAFAAALAIGNTIALAVLFSRVDTLRFESWMTFTRTLGEKCNWAPNPMPVEPDMIEWLEQIRANKRPI